MTPNVVKVSCIQYKSQHISPKNNLRLRLASKIIAKLSSPVFLTLKLLMSRILHIVQNIFLLKLFNSLKIYVYARVFFSY